MNETLELRLAIRAEHILWLCSCGISELQNHRFVDYSSESLFQHMIKYGIQEPIVIDRQYNIIDGHVRVSASIMAGRTSVPVKFKG